MPDADGKLTEAEDAQAKAWILDNWKDKHCSVCGTESWALGTHIARLPLANNHILGAYYPQIVLWCNKCGYTMQFNALHMGLMPRAVPQAPSQSTDAANPKPNAEAGNA